MRSENIHDKSPIEFDHTQASFANDIEETVMTREDTKKTIEEYFKDYSTGDFRMALDKHYTADAVFENTRVRIVGKENIIDWFTRSHALGYTESCVPVNILIGEDSVAVELEQEFTAYENVPNHYVSALTKGEPIRTSGLAGFYKMKDGKISSIRVYCTLNEYNPKIFGGKEVA
jgi:ketosteroid isomerase-like protein